ncbi:hypothetical protein SAMN05519104_8114 [Rhizobiales bacterium GAS188]|nr:hypothetical protein SAMN05519104_8114 [Rhizobiales bacterium GAS188]
MWGDLPRCHGDTQRPASRNRSPSAARGKRSAAPRRAELAGGVSPIRAQRGRPCARERSEDSAIGRSAGEPAETVMPLSEAKTAIDREPGDRRLGIPASSMLDGAVATATALSDKARQRASRPHSPRRSAMRSAEPGHGSRSKPKTAHRFRGWYTPGPPRTGRGCEDSPVGEYDHWSRTGSSPRTKSIGGRTRSRQRGHQSRASP